MQISGSSAVVVGGTGGMGEDDVAAFAEAAAQAPVRVSVDVHGGPAAGGRLLNKEGEPHQLADFRLTLESYLISVFNVTRLAAAAINKSEPVDDEGTRGVIIQTASIAGF